MARKRIHLVCNAHLDPVWLWPWEDGFAEAISTYRIAADFCEAQRGFVFNHNEALLYHWVEQHEPELFGRIQRLVRLGRWHLAGGAWLQPDVNGPSGESHIRHYLLGRRYFESRFGVYPDTAYNFDPFGHPEGLPQVLAGCGMRHYVFCRPDHGTWDLPADAFRWRDRSGAEVIARRSDDHYLTNGKIVEKLDKWLLHYAAEPETMILWGIGNHGGGPSAAEYAVLQTYMKDHPEYDWRESTPDAYFAGRLKHGGELRRIAGEIQNSAPGCYTSMSRIKRAHRLVEDLMLTTERLCGIAWWLGAGEHPAKDLDVAWKDVLFAQFHDVLPGSCGESGERDSLRLLGHAEEKLRRLRLAAIWALARHQPRAAAATTPVLVTNLQGRRWRGQTEVELCLDQNPSQCKNPLLRVRLAGRTVPFQRLAAETVSPSDWRVRLVLGLDLAPWQFARCEVSYVAQPAPKKPVMSKPTRITRAALRFRSPAIDLQIDPATGLIAHLRLGDGTPLAGPGALAPVLFRDLDHSWRSGTPRKELPKSFLGAAGFTKPDLPFRLATVTEAAALSPPAAGEAGAPLRIISQGPLRTVVEAVLVAGPSAIVRQYHILHRASAAQLELRDRIFFNHRDHMLKLAVPLVRPAGEWLAEACHSAVSRKPDPDGHRDQPVGRWVQVRCPQADLAIASTGTAGAALPAEDNTLYLNVLRSPAYASFGLRAGDWRHQRFLPRHDQGEHEVRWRLMVGRRLSEGAVRDLAEDLCQPPATQVFYPTGTKGPRHDPQDLVTVADSSLRLVALKRSEAGDELVVRLFNTTAKPVASTVRVAGWQRPIPVQVGAYGLLTLGLRPGRAGRWRRLDLVERLAE